MAVEGPKLPTALCMGDNVPSNSMPPFGLLLQPKLHKQHLHLSLVIVLFNPLLNDTGYTF